MKKISEKERIRIKRFNEQERMPKKRQQRLRKSDLNARSLREKEGRKFNNSIDYYNKHRNVSFDGKRKTLHLPEKMNFSDAFEETARTILIIAKFADTYRQNRANKWAYKLVSIDFNGLKQISTSAGLVLAATISKWQEKMVGKMKANHENWDDSIKIQLVQLGFFELFNLNPPKIIASKSRIRSIKYIKGTSADDDEKILDLKENIQSIIDTDLNKEKWSFLVSGITEAMTNVVQHAYSKKEKDEKSWFMTGGFNSDTRELKIAFYDQGMGIPASLPRTHGMEKIREFIAKFSPTSDNAAMIKAAVEMGRTSTAIPGRGKGLKDMLSFIQQRRSGYLSILSLKGLYKHEKQPDTKESDKIETLAHPIRGTLIIWSVKLEE